MDFRSKKRAEIMAQKRMETQTIKKEWADTGDADKMINAVREKRKPTIKSKDIPF